MKAQFFRAFLVVVFNLLRCQICLDLIVVANDFHVGMGQAADSHLVHILLQFESVGFSVTDIAEKQITQPRFMEH